jgi:creatinine amidohydrolase
MSVSNLSPRCRDPTFQVIAQQSETHLTHRKVDVTNQTVARATVFFADLTWVEARALLDERCVALLPVGAIEAHGPHLALDADVIIATGKTARRAAERLRADGYVAVVLPPVVYGVNHVGGPFAGTIPAASTVVATLVEQIISGVATFGPRRFGVANAHLEPAHVEAVRPSAEWAATRNQREPRWAATLSNEFRRGSRHAGTYETSLFLAAAPQKVRTNLLPTLPPIRIDLPGRLRAGARTFTEVGGTDAYFGDPGRATAEEGERLFDAMLVTSIEERDSAPPTGPR